MGIFDKFKKPFNSIQGKKKNDEEVSKKEIVVKARAEEAKAVKAPKTKTASQSRANFILLKTLVSEKAAMFEGKGVYTFIVYKQANKLEVKKAVKEIYGVNPEKVRMINVEGKQVRFGARKGRQSDWKKAIVTLPKGKTINIHEGV